MAPRETDHDAGGIPSLYVLAPCGPRRLASGLQRLMQQLLTPTFLWITGLVAVPIVLTVVLSIMLCLAARSERRKICAANERIARQLELTPETLQQVPSVLPAGFREGWQEYLEGMTFLQGRPHNSLVISEFIRDDAVLHGVKRWIFRFPLVHSLPSIATSLGVLGTFVGLTVGLVGLDLDAATASDGAGPIGLLVQSLAGAFVTSILGVLAALGIGLFAGAAETNLLGALHEFHEVIERRVPRLTAERLLAFQNELLEATRRDTEESRASLQTIANDLADSITNRFDQSLQELLVPHIQQMTAVVANQVSAAGQTSEKQARRFADEMVGQIAGSLQSSFGAMSSHVEAVGKQFSDSIRSLDRVVADTAKIVESQRAVLAAERGMVEGFRAVASEFGAALEKAIPFAEGMSRAVEVLAEQQDRLASITTSLDALCSRLDTTSTALTESARTSEVALRTSAESMRDVVNGTHAWSEAANAAIERFGASVKQTVADSLHEYDLALSQAVTGLRTAMRNLEEAAEDILAAAERHPEA